MSTTHSFAEERPPIYSTLADDPDMAELVEMFIDELPQRMAAADELAGRSDWDSLGRLAHQLKGAAGSYGFPVLTEAAAMLERACRITRQESEIREALRELTADCARVRYRDDA